MNRTSHQGRHWCALPVLARRRAGTGQKPAGAGHRHRLHHSGQLARETEVNNQAITPRPSAIQFRFSAGGTRPAMTGGTSEFPRSGADPISAATGPAARPAGNQMRCKFHRSYERHSKLNCACGLARGLQPHHQPARLAAGDGSGTLPRAGARGWGWINPCRACTHRGARSRPAHSRQRAYGTGRGHVRPGRVQHGPARR